MDRHQTKRLKIYQSFQNLCRVEVLVSTVTKYLKDQIKIFGSNQKIDWTEIQKSITGKSAQACRKKWVNFADPLITWDAITFAETEIFVERLIANKIEKKKIRWQELSTFLSKERKDGKKRSPIFLQRESKKMKERIEEGVKKKLEEIELLKSSRIMIEKKIEATFKMSEEVQNQMIANEKELEEIKKANSTIEKWKIILEKKKKEILEKRKQKKKNYKKMILLQTEVAILNEEEKFYNTFFDDPEELFLQAERDLGINF